MKQKTLFSIISILLSFFFAETVFAATVKYTCDYNYEYAIANHYSASTATFYTNNSTPKVKISSFNGFHIRTSLFSSNPWEYKIENWNDIKGTFADTTNCPNFALIYYFVGNNNATTVQVWLSNDKSYLEGRIQDWWGENNYHIANSTTYVAPSSEARGYYDKVVTHTSHINRTYKNYSLSSCKDETKVITSLSECKKTYEALVTYMKSSEDEVNSWITSGYISREDERTQAFFDALTDARTKWQEAKTELDGEQRKIDEAMGIVDGDSSGIGDNSQTSGDNSQSSSGNSQSGDDNTSNVSINNATVNGLCGSENYQKPMKYVGWVLSAIKLIIPIVLIALGVIDFFKVVVSSKGDILPKSIQSFVMRLISAIVIFFIPSLIHFLFTLVDDWNDYKTSYSECTKCLSNPKSC